MAYRQEVLSPVKEHLKGLHHTAAHDLSALSAGREVAVIVTGAPLPVHRIVLELLIAEHFKGAEIHLPQAGNDLVVHAAVKEQQCFLRAAHAAGIDPETVYLRPAEVPAHFSQRCPAVFGQGKIGFAAVHIVHIGLGASVTQQYDTSHLSFMGKPQKRR